MSDLEKWGRFKLGDDESLSLIYSENSKRLYSFGLKFTPNHAIVEDSLQDLFSDLVRNRKKLGDTDNIHFYLLKSFKRRLIRQLQKEKRYSLKKRNEDFAFEIHYTIEEKIINKEETSLKLQLLHEALIRLTPRQKEAVYYRFTMEMEYPEIAEMMGMTILSCRNLISRAIKSLKDSFQCNPSVLLLFLQKVVKKMV